MSEPLRILVVCTGNICRTPMAVHFLTEAAADAGLDVAVTSSGFLTSDQPASPMVQEVMRERGADLSGHRSQMSTPEMVADADLVVTMERRHARDLLSMAPEFSRRIFTLGGAVGLFEALDQADQSPSQRLEHIAEGRWDEDLLGGGEDEVADPYGRSREANSETADRLYDLSRRLIAALISAPGD